MEHDMSSGSDESKSIKLYYDACAKAGNRKDISTMFEEEQLAEIAFAFFNQGLIKRTECPKYLGESVKILSNMAETRSKDIKILLNIAVVRYYQSGLKDTDTFRKAINDICTQAGIKLNKVTPTDEVDASVIRLNHCLVLYHLRQYNDAVMLLEEMYKGLESLEEMVGIGLCLLLVECLLSMALPGRALTIVAHTEAIFLPQPLPPQAGTKIHPDTSSRSPDKGAARDDSESPLGNRNIMTSHTNASNDSIGGSSELRCSANQELLRGRLYLSRVRCLLMMRVLRLAKKEIKVVQTHAVMSGSQPSVTLIMVKSQLEYLRGSYKKAIKVLNQCASIPPPLLSFGPKLSVAYYNNLGVIHLGLAKPTLACFYLQKALHELKDSGDHKEGESCSLNNYGKRVESDLCHNLGITLLYMNKPAQAFDFLIEVVKIHSTNARLWMRLAECCIAEHKMNVDPESNPSSLKSCTASVGAGSHRKLCLAENSKSHDKKLSDQQHTTDAALPVPTLEFARLCLRNALVLIPDDISTAAITDEQEASGVLPDLYPCQPSPPMKGSQLLNSKLSCLMCSAYVCLCLGDYLMSLRHSQSLLAQISKNMHVDGLFKLFGHLYAGESLIYLDRVPEAITHFDPRLMGDINFGSSDENTAMSIQDPSNSSNSGLFPYDEQSYKKLLLYNLCVAYATRGQYDKAGTLLKEISSSKGGTGTPAHFVMLTLYIHLQTGNQAAAKKVIKNHIPPS